MMHPSGFELQTHQLKTTQKFPKRETSTSHNAAHLMQAMLPPDVVGHSRGIDDGISLDVALNRLQRQVLYPP